ncbi:hypothetical protein GCM10022251_25090 [Phytohabitans flavus]|uniref:IrrE N-terminal-like domain-containing protein n=1 Tax=Phytohabitans flavus TaxID=1076124 RepID=A0A6F8XR53_9ACTN|nr:hypothetical protein [Phytohabitans flavus]BCB76287.1 hypothetical protein Pflav_026970 [Phytohabitans flavus]
MAHNPGVVWWRRRPECPVRPVEQDWIERSMDWFVAEFGTAVLAGPIVLPTDDYFPGAYVGSRADVERVMGLLCGHMGVDPERVELEHFSDEDRTELSSHVPLNTTWSGAAGHHRMRDGRSVIGIREQQARRPMALVATIAHELGHALLIGSDRISVGEREDHEPLTDLLTVYFGLGIFTANAAFEFFHEARGGITYTGRNTYTRTSRLGYLTEPMYGYALARYAWLRGESDPDWADHLDTNPRSFLMRGLRYLATIEPAGRA